MTKQICHWKGCKTVIDVDTSFESKTNLNVSVVGWCPLHHTAHRIYTELEKIYCESNNLSWPIGSLTYKEHKKKLNMLYKLADSKARLEVVE